MGTNDSGIGSYPHRVATTVAGAMTASGWSEKKLAETTGIARVTLRRRLAGSPFTVAELAAIAAALDTTVTALLQDAA